MPMHQILCPTWTFVHKPVPFMLHAMPYLKVACANRLKLIFVLFTAGPQHRLSSLCLSHPFSLLSLSFIQLLFLLPHLLSLSISIKLLYLYFFFFILMSLSLPLCFSVSPLSILLCPFQFLYPSIFSVSLTYSRITLFLLSTSPLLSPLSIPPLISSLRPNMLTFCFLYLSDAISPLLSLTYFGLHLLLYTSLYLASHLFFY